MTFSWHQAERNQKYMVTLARSTPLAAAVLASLLTTAGPAAARRHHHHEHAAATVESRAGGAPLMAVVSLHSQQITVYGSGGWILRAPVSSGQKGRETPAGVFSVIQKDADHHSNLYDDAWMPHMHRITWSGIALHGGPLPGYAASHGCVRLPYAFAEHLFDESKLGLRVIIAPGDAAPVEITHPVLFSPKPETIAAASAAQTAQAKADDAKREAETEQEKLASASREASQAAAPVHAAEKLKRKADAHLRSIERQLAHARSDDARQHAEDAKATAAGQVAAAETQLTAVKAALQSSLDTAAFARQAASAAETKRATAAEAARNAALNLEPVSVFISRKSQRLYVRQGFRPVLDVPVAVQDGGRPIGTHVFTAMALAGDASGLRWAVVSLDRTTAPDDAGAALDRIAIPQDALDRIAAAAVPGASLIVSDEALSKETGKGTDFVVVMNGEPHGGIKFRPHSVTTAHSDHARTWVSVRRSPSVESSVFGFPGF
jgi:hypothetical protein